MSNRVHKLDTPGTYDEVHLGHVTEYADGTANILIRYCLQSQVVLQDTSETLNAATVTAWKADWDAATHSLEEHFLTHWVSENNLAAGALQLATKS